MYIVLQIAVCSTQTSELLPGVTGAGTLLGIVAQVMCQPFNHT